MKITKLVHSCLLVEAEGKKLLVDPGNYSWSSGVVKQEDLKDIDYVVITHIHPDHCCEEFVTSINTHSPNATWYSTSQVVKKLRELGITGRTNSDDTNIKFVTSEHADLSPWFSEQPEHTSFVLFGDLLIGGDCHTITESHGARIFGAAINGGPWAGVVGFTKMIEAMSERPEKVIPLHDWHWQKEARNAIYTRLPEVLAQFDVAFIPLESGREQDI